MENNRFEFIEQTGEGSEAVRPSLTYWQDAWRRLRKNKFSMLGIFLIFAILLFGLIGPKFTKFSYSDQINKYKNLPPRLKLHKVGGEYFYFSSDYNLFLVEEDGTLIDRLKLDPLKRDMINKVYQYEYNGEIATLDFSYNTLASKQGYDYDYTIEFRGETVHEVYGTR